MRRSDIARISIVTDGADYIFTLPKHCLSEGPASDSSHRFTLAGRNCHLIASIVIEANQSLRGHHELYIRLDFPRYCPRLSPKSIGVHRYKPELLMMFPPL